MPKVVAQAGLAFKGMPLASKQVGKAVAGSRTTRTSRRTAVQTQAKVGVLAG